MLRRLIRGWMLAFSISAPALARTPVLTIDTGGHKSSIMDLCFTRDGRCLVSASKDDTVRVRDVSTGETAGVIRGHIAPESDKEWVDRKPERGLHRTHGRRQLHRFSPADLLKKQVLGSTIPQQLQASMVRRV